MSDCPKSAAGKVNKLISFYDQKDREDEQTTDWRLRRRSFTDRYLAQFADDDTNYREKDSLATQSTKQCRHSSYEASYIPAQTRRDSVGSHKQPRLNPFDSQIVEGDESNVTKDVKETEVKSRRKEEDFKSSKKFQLQNTEEQGEVIMDFKVQKADKSKGIKDIKQTEKVSTEETVQHDLEKIFDAPLIGQVAKPIPTVVPAEYVNFSEDVKELHSALEKGSKMHYVLVQILTSRSYLQRREISDAFYEFSGKSLTSNLKNELTGDFERVMVALVSNKHDFYAKELRKAMKIFGTNEDRLIELLCCHDSSTIEEIKTSYQKLFKCSLENTIRDETSGDFKNIMEGLVSKHREELPSSSAEDITNKLCNDDKLSKKTITNILVNYKRPFLFCVFFTYTQLTSKDFATVIEDKFIGDCRKALLAIYKSIMNIHEYFATRINDSFIGLGTNEDTLIEISVTRCEIDLKTIVDEYNAKYSKPLYDKIKDETSGNFRLSLLALFGDEDVNNHYNLMNEAYAQKEDIAIKEEETCISSVEENGSCSGSVEDIVTCIGSVEDQGLCIASFEEKETSIGLFDEQGICIASVEERDICSGSIEEKEICSESVEEQVIRNGSVEAKEICIRSVEEKENNNFKSKQLVDEDQAIQCSAESQESYEVHHNNYNSHIDSTHGIDEIDEIHETDKQETVEEHKLVNQTAQNLTTEFIIDNSSNVEQAIVCDQAEEHLLDDQQDGQASGKYETYSCQNAQLNISDDQSVMEIKSAQEINVETDVNGCRIYSKKSNENQVMVENQTRLVAQTEDHIQQIEEDKKLAAQFDIHLPSHITGMECFPTIVSAKGFDPTKDACYLRKHFDGDKPDESIVIDVLATKNFAQREQIITEFNSQNLDLRELLKKECHGYYQEIMLALMESPLRFITKELDKALQAFTVREEVVIEIICSANDIELENIILEYQELFGEQLYDAVSKPLTGPLKDLMIELLNMNRRDCEDIASLYSSISEFYRHSNLSQDKIIDLMTSYKFHVLFSVFYIFENLLDSQFGDVITEVCTGINRVALLTMYKSIMNRHAFYAEILHQAMKGYGTNEAALIRVIVGRCEIDLQNIKSEYQKNFCKDLRDTVHTETSRSFKDVLILIIKGNKKSKPSYQQEGSVTISDCDSSIGVNLTPVLESDSVFASSQKQIVEVEISNKDTCTQEHKEDTCNQEYKENTNIPEYIEDAYPQEYIEDAYPQEYIEDECTQKYNEDASCTKESNEDVSFTQEYNEDASCTQQLNEDAPTQKNNKNTVDNDICTQKSNEVNIDLEMSEVKGAQECIEDDDLQKFISQSKLPYPPCLYSDEKLSPTMHEAESFRPKYEAKILVNNLAKKSLTTILTTLTKVNVAQRQELLKYADLSYGKDVLSKLEPHLSERCMTFIKYLTLSRCDILAHELKKAICGTDNHNITVVEILVTLDQENMSNVSNSYENIFNNSLIDDISANTSGMYQNILIALITTPRSQPTLNPIKLAKRFAKLDQASNNDSTTLNEEFLIRCITTFSPQFLFDMFYVYASLMNVEFRSVIAQLSIGDVQMVLTEIHDWIYERNYFAAKLQYEGLNNTLTRILTTRCEIDLEKVKEELESSYGMSLIEYCSGITDEYYKIAVNSVINGNRGYQFEINDESSIEIKDESSIEISQTEQLEGKQQLRVHFQADDAKEMKSQEGVKCDGAKERENSNISFEDTDAKPDFRKSDKSVQFLTGVTIPAYLLEDRDRRSYSCKGEHPYDATEECHTLKKAMTGIIVDEKSVIEILSKRNASQRMQLCIKYQDIYGKALVTKFKKRFTGDFENLVVALITPIHAYLAKEVHNSVKGIGTDEKTLVEIICLHEEDSLQAISAGYKNLFNSSLQHSVANDTSENIKKLLVQIISERRSNHNMKPYEHAVKFCKSEIILDDIVGIMGKYTWLYLFKFMSAYEKISGYNFPDLIKKHAKGDTKLTLMTIHDGIMCRYSFFAEKLHSAIKAVNTKESTLSRIIVSRKDIDLQEIKTIYEEKYKQPLAKDIKGATSGSYRKLILALL